MENMNEYIVVLNSKSGRSTRPGPGTPFAKYFLESERIAMSRERVTAASTADLLAEIFPAREYPDGPVFHRVQTDSDGRQEIVTSWCVFPVDNSSPKHVSMTIPLPSLNTTSTPRTKFCKNDRLKLLEACYGGADNVRHNVRQTALIGSLVVGATGRHRISVCIPSEHVRLQSIASGLHLRPLFEDETGVRRPYLFKLTLIHNGPGTNRSKSGIPISNNLFFSLFWGDYEMMRLLETFVPDRQAATGRDLTATTATTTTATTVTTTTATTTTAPSSEISSRAYAPAYLPGRGKGLMSVRAQRAEMSKMIRDAREKLEHIFHTCLADTRSTPDEMKFSISILSTLLRDSTASKTLEGREQGGQGMDVDDDETRISLHEFADIVDKLADVVNPPPPHHVVYQPPCHRVLAIFKYYLDRGDDSYTSFEQVNPALFNALRNVGLLGDDTIMMIP